ncbi:hypothetical protein Glove_110g128 [Diversispora epigaea]|uniref:BTB domain-containing protein n=1 Tax=Diversispora epigaea TaxID=1348612 RepID=A0A397J1S2_9GLOM|nr:hypothetical protein Glove_110g128 [Diversispora epigaea]
MTLKFFEKLSQNLIELLNDKDDYNVIIEVENKEKLFTTHSNVLKCRSPYFYKELENIQPNENNIKIITMPNISARIFDVILKYIYSGIVNLENVETRFIFDLMLDTDNFEIEELTNKLEILLIETKTSWLKTHFSLIFHTIFNKNNFKNLENFYNDIIAKYPNLIFDSNEFISLPESALIYIYSGIVNLENVETRFIFDLMLDTDNFEIEELTNKLEILLIETKTSWLKTHFSLIFHTIFNKNNFKNLENFYNDIIAKYPNLIFDSNEFISLPESALMSLLKRDDLQIEEIKIWDYIIKWGISQNPEIYDKIKLYKKILDKQLWEDIKKHIALPDRPIKSVILPPRTTLITELPSRTKEPFSTIISEEHVAEISAWIDRKTINYPTTNNPYDFQLILHGTRDGFAPQTFWNICHGHSNTVVVAKVKGTDEIIGGYNPLAWDSTTDGEWAQTNDSFIFSLKNGNIQNSILSRVKDPQFAIRNVSKKGYQHQVGPKFGWKFQLSSYVSNFTLDNNSCCCDCISYEKPIRTLSKNFSIVNYEVFKVVKKILKNIHF